MDTSNNRTAATSSPQHDLSTEEGVRAYITGSPWTSTEIMPLSGGNANYIFRLRLATPFRGRETVVLKHAKPYVKSMKDVHLMQERQVRYFLYFTFLTFGIITRILVCVLLL